MKKQLLFMALLCVGSLTFAQKQNDKLDKQINSLIETENYSEAINNLLELDAKDGLSEFWLTQLSHCYFLNEQYQECIQSCYRWLSEFGTIGGDGNKFSAYRYLGNSYLINDDYGSALIWLKKSLDVIESADFTDGSWNASLTDSRINRDMGATCCLIGVCFVKLGMSNEDVPFFKLGMVNRAVLYYKKGINLQCQYLNISIKDVQNGKVHDGVLGAYLRDYGTLYFLLNDEADGFEVIKLAALCGDQDAIAMCREDGINYHQVKAGVLRKLFE